jgi:Zn-dependent protease with chaperone function
LVTLVPHAHAQAADSVSALVDAAPDSAQARDLVAEALAGFTPENRAYQQIRTALRLTTPLVPVLLALLLYALGVFQRLRDLANARARGRYLRMLIFFTGYSVIMALVLFPLSVYEGFALEHRFGFSTQTFGAWALDELKSLVFGIIAVGVIPLLAFAWRAVESSPRRWWLWIAAGTLPVALAAVLLQPLVFDPMFNEFTPLQDQQLKAEILALGARADVPAKNVYQVDMSKQTKKVNAYVNGFGASQRIVLWDTTLESMSKDEILFVMGHEMGHYVLKHIWKGLAVIALLAFVAFGLVAWLTNACLARFGAAWGVSDVRDLAALPLVLAMLGLVSYLSQPVTNGLSRITEHEADVFALEVTQDGDAGGRAFLKLAALNKSDPEPAAWIRVLLYSHPPLADRIRFARDYKPWEKGEPNRAFKGE